jgi:hypothetical protein
VVEAASPRPVDKQPIVSGPRRRIIFESIKTLDKVGSGTMEQS